MCFKKYYSNANARKEGKIKITSKLKNLFFQF